MQKDHPYISHLCIYPVKGCRGVAVQQAELKPMGFALDRRWMFVDEKNVFLTQRQDPTLATVEIEVLQDQIRIGASGNGSVTFSSEQRPEGTVDVRIFEDTVRAFEVDPEADRWISDTLGKPARLVGIPEGPARHVDPKYGRSGDFVSFADAYPVLIVGSSSLADLNARMKSPLPMDRFRPNIVVDGSAPYAEDAWKMVETGDVALRLVKRCARCEVTTVDQRTGAVGKEPLTTLSTYRKEGNKVFFAMNAIPERVGIVRVGDSLRHRT